MGVPGGGSASASMSVLTWPIEGVDFLVVSRGVESRAAAAMMEGFTALSPVCDRPGVRVVAELLAVLEVDAPAPSNGGRGEVGRLALWSEGFSLSLRSATAARTSA
jgi:hypothetical protein